MGGGRRDQVAVPLAPRSTVAVTFEVRAQFEASHPHLASAGQAVAGNSFLVENIEVSDFADEHERERSVIEPSPIPAV